MNMNHNMYPRLLIMSMLSLISMYFLMYSMVHVTDHFYNNMNKFYMAAIMTAPMVVFELLLMGAMYQNRQLNAWLILISIGALVIFFMFIRQQTAIGDRQFLRAMIPITRARS
jgi:cell division protein FtsW (lipid II flippase)